MGYSVTDQRSRYGVIRSEVPIRGSGFGVRIWDLRIWGPKTPIPGFRDLRISWVSGVSDHFWTISGPVLDDPVTGCAQVNTCIT